MIHRVAVMSTRLEFSRFKVQWTISDYKGIVTSFGFTNGQSLRSAYMDIQINDVKCFLKMYPHGKHEDDLDCISVDVQVLDDIFLMIGKVKIAIFDGGVHIKEVEKDVTISGACTVCFDGIMKSDDTINDLIITCEMIGDFKIDELVYEDVYEDEDDNDVNIPLPLR